MTLDITHDEKKRFNVLINADFYVYVDLDRSILEDESGALKEADLDYIFEEVERYYREMREMEMEDPNPYSRYGVRESDFI